MVGSVWWSCNHNPFSYWKILDGSIATHVGEHDNPVVGQDVGDKVVLDEGGKAGLVSPDGKESSPCGEADVSNDNGDSVALLEQRR